MLFYPLIAALLADHIPFPTKHFPYLNDDNAALCPACIPCRHPRPLFHRFFFFFFFFVHASVPSWPASNPRNRPPPPPPPPNTHTHTRPPKTTVFRLRYSEFSVIITCSVYSVSYSILSLQILRHHFANFDSCHKCWNTIDTVNRVSRKTKGWV